MKMIHYPTVFPTDNSLVSVPYRFRIISVSFPYRFRIISVSFSYRSPIVLLSSSYHEAETIRDGTKDERISFGGARVINHALIHHKFFAIIPSTCPKIISKFLLFSTNFSLIITTFVTPESPQNIAKSKRDMR